MKQNANWSAKRITFIALAMAVVCLSTMVIQIPIPLGYMHLGNCCILLIGVFFDTTTGLLAAGIGSAMADLLLGYPQWIIPTLIIKGLMGYSIARLSKKKDERVRVMALRTLRAVVVGILIMIVGYILFGTILYGSFTASIAQGYGLSVEGILGIVLFYIIGIVLEKGKLIHLQRQP